MEEESQVPLEDGGAPLILQTKAEQSAVLVASSVSALGKEDEMGKEIVREFSATHNNSDMELTSKHSRLLFFCD